jgi:hypothetical protein
MKNKTLFDQQYLHELFDYNLETGVFTWKKIKHNFLKGKVAGCLHSSGYIQIRIKDKNYQAHRLAWMMHYGEDPKDLFIDHINGNKTDNRICNLRLATNQQNQRNNKSKGFYWNKQKKKWKAHIRVEGKLKHLGLFDCPLLARLAYEKASKMYFGEFSNC